MKNFSLYKKFLSKIFSIVLGIGIFFIVFTGNVYWNEGSTPNLVVPSEASSNKDDPTKINSPNFKIDLSSLAPIEGKKQTTQWGWKWLFNALMSSVTKLLLTIIPVLAGVSLIIAGYFYIFSFSDGELQSKSKNIIKYNLMAVLVAFLSYVIISIIAWFFN